MIIGILGSIGSGKNTAAKHLVQEHGYRQDSFASVLKDLLSAMLGWDRELLEGITEESRQWREQVDIWWASKLGIPHFTPRFAMQNIGTDVLRQHFNNNIWVLTLEKRIVESENKNIVISAVRFKNEYYMLKDHGAKFLYVEKELPAWFDVAKSYNAIQNPSEEDLQPVIDSGLINVHRSEWDWVGLPHDEIILNTKDLKHLYDSVDNFVRKEKG